jgi:hypothetical protein
METRGNEGKDVRNMTLRLVKPRPERRDGHPKPRPETCPVCGGRVEVVYARNNQQVSTCVDCGTGITVPTTAWDRAREKSQASAEPEPPERIL